MRDTWGRTIDYLRISLTDRCNLRCRYCMPSDVPSVSYDDILRYEEILEICEAAVSLGINRFKVTGGEPLVRKGALSFISRLTSLPGVRDVTLTTNGQFLQDALPALMQAGGSVKAGRTGRDQYQSGYALGQSVCGSDRRGTARHCPVCCPAGSDAANPDKTERCTSGRNGITDPASGNAGP